MASKDQLRRHSLLDMFMHWFNAFCWIVLFLTGLGLVSNPELNPVGDWYPTMLRALFGGGENLLVSHIILGCIWAGVFTLHTAFNLKENLLFVKEMFTVEPSRDGLWLIKKNIQMTMGYKGLKRLGFSQTIPDQGFYNVGQKMFGQASIMGSLVLVATGLLMTVSPTALAATALVSWAITIHYLAAGLVFAGLLVHIYMAAISPDEKPAFESMFTGHVPVEYAKHHHKLWYDEVTRNSN